MTTEFDPSSRWAKWVLRRIVLLLKLNNRPTYIGEISTHVGISIQKTEMIIDHIVNLGAVRFMTFSEKNAQGYDERCYLVILLDASLCPHTER